MATSAKWALAADLGSLGADYAELPGVPASDATLVGRVSARSAMRGARRARKALASVRNARDDAERTAACRGGVSDVLCEMREFEEYVGRVGRARVVEVVSGGREGREVVIVDAEARRGVRELFGKISGGLKGVSEAGEFCGKWEAEEDVVAAEFARCAAVFQDVKTDLKTVGEGKKVATDFLAGVREEFCDEGSTVSNLANELAERAKGALVLERVGNREQYDGGYQVEGEGMFRSPEGGDDTASLDSVDQAARRRRHELDLLLSP